MGRHANGEGSIYRRKDGRYEAAIYLLTTSGTRKRVRVYARTRAEVHDRLTEAKAKVQAGTPIPDRQVRLGEYLDYWLEQVVKPNKRPATYAQCEMIVRLYIRPGLGQLPLARLTVRGVQSFLNEKMSEGHSVPKVQVIRKVLSAALTCAMRDELVGRNVARLVQLPKHDATEVHPWSADEIKQFLGAARTHTLYPAFLLLGLYGMRRGEVLGLRWQDIGFEQGVIHVRQQLQRGDDGLQLGPLKTRAGRRDLPLLGIVREALLTKRARHVAMPDEGLVFTAAGGRPLEASTLVRSFQGICRDNRLRQIRVHDMRHSLATLLKDMQVPVRDAQLILGHARVSTTQEIYEHGNVAVQREALGKIEKLFMRTVGSMSLRCRQFSRQGWFFGDLFTTINCGAGEGTLTPGLILGKSDQATIKDRVTEVVSVVKRAQRQWLIGVVAVKTAVRFGVP
jgi:integrase